MKRFYAEVGTQAVAGGWQVTLDGREVRTVGGAVQAVPTPELAAALAREWADQGEKIDPARFAFRDLADYAIDVVAQGRAALADTLTAYGDTDTLLYRADPGEPLHARQCALWDPLVAAFAEREQVVLTPINGILHRQQSAAALARLNARLRGLDPFALAGIEAMTKLAASLIIGLSAAEEGAGADPLALWRAACLEEEWQADLWGRDPEAEARRAGRQADFLSACAFTRLARAAPLQQAQQSAGPRV